MELYYMLDTNILLALLLTIVLIIAKSRLDWRITLNKIFILTAALILFQLVMESFTWVIEGIAYPWLIFINQFVTVLLFVSATAATYFWYRLVKIWVIPETIRHPKTVKWMLIPLAIISLLSVSSPFTGLLFTVDATNIFYRGPWFIVSAASCYFYLLSSVFIVIANRHNLLKSMYHALLLFAITPAIGGMIQVLIEGTLMIWASSALSLVLVYIYLQQRMMQFDTLTGAWTRGSFDNYIETRIENAKDHDTLALIFIDLDDLKYINDTYGHLEGDLALQTAVKLLKNCVCGNDIIARFGGDEFVIVANKCTEKDTAMNSVEDRIALMKYNFEKYNETSQKDYDLSFSYGYEEFDNNKYNIWQFIDHIDRLMYQDKKSTQQRTKYAE